MKPKINLYQRISKCLINFFSLFSILCTNSLGKSTNSKSGNARKQIANKSRTIIDDNLHSPQRISANINETVILNCNLEFPDNNSPVPYVIQWQKLNVKIPIFIWYEGYPPHTGDGYQGRTSLAGQASLQLSNVQESDQGKCFLRRRKNNIYLNLTKFDY